MNTIPNLLLNNSWFYIYIWINCRHIVTWSIAVYYDPFAKYIIKALDFHLVLADWIRVRTWLTKIVFWESKERLAEHHLFRKTSFGTVQFIGIRLLFYHLLLVSLFRDLVIYLSLWMLPLFLCSTVFVFWTALQ